MNSLQKEQTTNEKFIELYLRFKAKCFDKFKMSDIDEIIKLFEVWAKNCSQNEDENIYNKPNNCNLHIWNYMWNNNWEVCSLNEQKMLDKKCKTKDCNRMISSKMSKSKLCTRCAQKKWNKEHEKEIKIYHKKHRKKYYKENKERELAINQKYRENNKVKISKINYKYYKKRTEYYKNLSKKYYEKNKEKRAKYNLEYVKKKYKEDLAFRNRRKLGTALGGVIRYYLKTGKVSNPLPELGVDWKGIMKVLTPIPKPRKDYHVDHIIPLYKFDLSDIEQILTAFAPENHRWTLAKDNMGRDRPNTRKRKYKID